MKKKILLRSIVVVMLVSILAFSLAGCREIIINNDFNAKFGEDGKNHVTKDMTKIDFVGSETVQKDTIFSALEKVNANYKKHNYVGVRGKATGNTNGKVFNKDVNTQQSIFITNIQERDSFDKNKVKYYHEDASVSDYPSVKPVIVQIMQTHESATKKNIKVREATGSKSVKLNGLQYPVLKSYDEKEPKQFNNMNDYLTAYHQDLSVLLPYVLDATTLDEAKCSYSVDKDGFITLHLEVNSASLQDATLDKRETIVIKTAYSGIEATANQVTYTQLSVDIQLWQDFYIRSISTTESYNLSGKLGIMDIKQTCDLSTKLWFSYDPLELPMKNFEF